MALTLPIGAKIFNKKYRSKEPPPTRRYMRISGGSVVTPDTSMQVSAYYRGVTYISSQIAKLPWEIKDKDNESQKGRIYKLLNISPNGEMTAFHFKSYLIQSAISYGNGYAEIVRDLAGNPTALYPMDSRDVQVFRAPDRSLVYRIIAGSGANPTKDVYLPAEDVFHLPNLVTSDGIVGNGVVSYGANTLGISLGADKFAGALYSNGGMPSGAITAPGALSDEAFERIKKSWAEAHGGSKAGGTAVLEEGVSYEPISFSPEVLQFLESRKFNVTEIARFLGLPPTKLFDPEAATFNNIEHSNLEAATDTLDIWARNLESEADKKLLNDGFAGRRTEFDMFALFRGDMETRARYFNVMMQNGAMTPNEIRKKEGFAPYEAGDRFFIATNNFTPMDRLDDIVDKNTKISAEGDSNNQNIDAATRDFLLSRTNRG